MKYISIVILLLLLPIATAETGIVLNASDYVQYKYDTNTSPILQPGEYIVLFEDINSISKGAKYNGMWFVNPEVPEFVRYEEKLVAVAATGLDPITQAAISAATGAGAAYLVVKRRRKEE